MTEIVQPGGSGGGGSSLTVTDNSTTVTNVTEIVFVGATVSNGGGGIADVTIIGSANSFSVGEVPSGAVNDSNAIFVLAHTPIINTEAVYLNGARQQRGGGDYSISGATITFNAPPLTGSIILSDYQY